MIKKQPFYINENNIFGEVICSLASKRPNLTLSNIFDEKGITNRWVLNDRIQLLIKYSHTPEDGMGKRSEWDRYYYSLNYSIDTKPYFDSKDPLFLALIAIHNNYNDVNKIIPHRIYYLSISPRVSLLSQQTKTDIDLFIKKGHSPILQVHFNNKTELIDIPWSDFPDILFEQL